MLDKASKFIFFTVFMKHGHSIFPIWSFGCLDIIPSEFSLRSILNFPKHQKSISHIQNFDNHKFNVFAIQFTRLVMKTFKGGVFASVVFDAYF